MVIQSCKSWPSFMSWVWSFLAKTLMLLCIIGPTVSDCVYFSFHECPLLFSHLFVTSVVWTLPVWNMVVGAVLQHEPRWESGSSPHHSAPAVLRLEDNPDHVRRRLFCFLTCMFGICKEWAEGRWASQRGGSSQEGDEGRWAMKRCDLTAVKAGLHEPVSSSMYIIVSVRSIWLMSCVCIHQPIMRAPWASSSSLLSCGFCLWVTWLCLGWRQLPRTGDSCSSCRRRAKLFSWVRPLILWFSLDYFCNLSALTVVVLVANRQYLHECLGGGRFRWQPGSRFHLGQSCVPG